jgi:hypothetical protein
MKIEVSNGEILDKFSILEIKKAEVKDDQKLRNIEKEYSTLKVYADRLILTHEDLYIRLLETNKKLWKIEDEIRICERNDDFGKNFISLARSVYIVNDERANIKKEINLATNSEIVEEKSYESVR